MAAWVGPRGVALVMPDSAYLAEKGAPGVELFVRPQGSKSRLWRGEPVAPSDVLSFVAACDGFRYVRALQRVGGRYVGVATSACEGSNAILPFTLVVDDVGDSEDIAIVMTRDRISEGLAHDFAETKERSEAAWTFGFALPKHRP